ncbi:MAG: thiamine biosynthesis protein ThiS [Frankiales bacterium]|nr:thiamine biosynthesis protein ThiS [Frankiales bacterium]
MRLTVNGEARDVGDGTSLVALLEQLGLPVRSVVVELNGVALVPSEVPAVTLQDSDVLELVRAVAGG